MSRNPKKFRNPGKFQKSQNFFLGFPGLSGIFLEGSDWDILGSIKIFRDFIGMFWIFHDVWVLFGFLKFFGFAPIFFLIFETNFFGTFLKKLKKMKLMGQKTIFDEI